MKAIQMIRYGSIEKSVKLKDIQIPTIESNEVLIQVYASSVNPADYKIIQGEFKPLMPHKHPITVGLDISGVVSKVGNKVVNLSVGDEVYTSKPAQQLGAFAEYTVADASIVVKKPRSISFEETAGLASVGLTSSQIFELGKLKSGDKVLIHAGSGGVGTFAIQYAKAKGAFVYSTTSTKNVAWVKALGADRVIDYKRENYLDVVSDLDIVVDALGGQYTTDAFKVIRKGGTVVGLNGPVDSFAAQAFGLNRVLKVILSLMRWKVSRAAKSKSATFRFVFATPNAKHLEEIVRLVDTNKIRPVIDRVFPLEQSIEALQYVKSGRAKGKVIIKVK